jgi:hypothetical protein
MTDRPATGDPRDSGDDGWAARRRDAAVEHVARLDRQRATETEQARRLLSAFVEAARERALPTVPLRARALNGRSLYRTGLTGWYLRRNGSLAVDERGDFYVMSAPTSLAASLRGTTLTPSDPPLVVGVGGRDGESMPIDELLRLRLEATETWTR